VATLTQGCGLLGRGCSSAAWAGPPSPPCMPMRLTWGAAGTVEGTGDPAGAVAPQVAGRSGRTGLPRPLRRRDRGFTLRLFAGLRVRVTSVQRGRWKDRRLPGGIRLWRWGWRIEACQMRDFEETRGVHFSDNDVATRLSSGRHTCRLPTARISCTPYNQRAWCVLKDAFF
jgi:hypothetical protein